MENEILLVIIGLFLTTSIVLFIVFIANNFYGIGIITAIIAVILIMSFNDVKQDKSYKIEQKVIPIEDKYFIDTDVWEITDKEGEIITIISKKAFEGDEY